MSHAPATAPTGRRSLPCLPSVVVVAALCVVAPAHGDATSGRPGPGPGRYKILAGDGVIRLPFELHGGDVRFEGEVNGRKVRMLIDNGIMWDPILFFGSPAVDALGLHYDGTIEVGGGGEGRPVTSRTASGITIRFPGVEFTDQTAVVTPHESGVAELWAGAEGQVSATFLKHFVVGFDFDSMTMTLVRPDRFRYSGAGVEVPMTPLANGGWSIPMRLVLEDGRRISLDVMMDLGLGDQFEISATGEQRIRAPERSVPASLGFGAQGETLGRVGRIASVELGGYVLKEVIAGFIDEGYTGLVVHEAMVGLGLLSRFNFVYDYPHGRMFIQPNRRFGDPFEHDMSGLGLRRVPADGWEVKRVQPGSPADDAGLRVGDRIIRIDGRAPAGSDAWELRSRLQRDGASVEMLVRAADGSERKVVLRLRRLI